MDILWLYMEHSLIELCWNKQIQMSNAFVVDDDVWGMNNNLCDV